MDKVLSHAQFANFQVLKEPLGFIKIIEFLLSIFAFATTSNGGSSFAFIVQVNTTNKRCDLSYSYPYDFASQLSSDFETCVKAAGATPINISPGSGSIVSSSQFFVFVGVMAFLYCLVAVGIYVFAASKLKDGNFFPTVDFAITIVFAILWLAGSSAWTQGVVDIKSYTSGDNAIHHVKECHDSIAGYTCTASTEANYANINVSAMFGFLCFLVWAGNCWFAYKETNWFQKRTDGVPPAGQAPEVPNAAAPGGSFPSNDQY